MILHVRSLQSWLSKWPRLLKGVALGTFDTLAIALAAMLAVSIEFGTTGHWTTVFYLTLLAAGLIVPTLALLGHYRSVVRALGSTQIYVLCGVTAASVCAVALMDRYAIGADFRAAVLVLFALQIMCAGGGGRIIARDLLNFSRKAAVGTIIYGAGEAGRRLAESLRSGSPARIVGFVDDDPLLRGAKVAGIEIVAPARLPDLVKRRGANRVLLAIPSATRKRRLEILDSLRHLGVAVQIVPDLMDILSGSARVDDLRDVQIADLLLREPLDSNGFAVDSCLRGKTVLVTGAGGSIGAELCRQILRQGPSRLLLLEICEHALYQVERELAQAAQSMGSKAELVPLLGSVLNKPRLLEIMRAFRVNTVYHAAAYKHVPLVEQNVIEGIRNNVVGTLYAAEAATESAVDTFVLVSSDKAVNPPNVMGATKRFAEIVLQGLQEATVGTRFCMVRFGNVLGSSGSVVPLFRDQIVRGGPVTVTHPDVSRYFMTIAEAVHLMLQAGTMGKGGDLFVLDMGKPVRIADLAKRMIELSGLSVKDEKHPEGEIEIRFTGLRPAEKLTEELLIGRNVSGTAHPMIMRAVEHFPQWEVVKSELKELMQILDAGDAVAARRVLERVVVEYSPSDDTVDLLLRQSQLRDAHRAAGKVTDLTARRGLN
mgnify:CR=1 FL=1